MPVSEDRPDAPPPVLADEVSRQVASRVARVLGRNRVARLGPVRRRWPLWRIRPSVVVVTRREDVDEVLHRPEAFVFPYVAHLPGEFLLASGPVEHRRQRAELDAVLRCEDAGRLRRLVTDQAEARVERARRTGRMDVVAAGRAAFCWLDVVVTLRTVARHLGPAARASTACEPGH